MLLMLDVTTSQSGGTAEITCSSAILTTSFRLQRDWWRVKGVVKDLKTDGVELYHGLSGELPLGLAAAGIPGVVTVHDLSSYSSRVLSRY